MTPLLSLFVRFWRGRERCEGTTSIRGFSLTLDGVMLLVDLRRAVLGENGIEYEDAGGVARGIARRLRLQQPVWLAIDIRVRKGSATELVTAPAWYEKLAALALVRMMHRASRRNVRKTEREKISKF